MTDTKKENEKCSPPERTSLGAVNVGFSRVNSPSEE